MDFLVERAPSPRHPSTVAVPDARRGGGGTIGLVLAGGRSSRMGCDKCWVTVPTPLGPLPMLTAVIQALNNQVDMVFVLARDRDQALPMCRGAAIQVLYDVVDEGEGDGDGGVYAGPLHSLSRALRQVLRDWGDAAAVVQALDSPRPRPSRVVLCACDSVSVTSQVVEGLVAAQSRGTLDWSGLRDDAAHPGPQPFPTCWDTESLCKALAELEATGSARLTDLLRVAERLGQTCALIPGETPALNGVPEVRSWWQHWGKSNLMAGGTTAKVPSMPLTAVVLAAGKGTRMRSDLPKVLHTLHGHPLLAWVVHRAAGVRAGRTIVIVGHGAPEVESTMHASGRVDLEYVMQSEQRGTGHALACALPALKNVVGPVLILSGDVPLLRQETLEALIAAYHQSRAGFSLIGFEPEDPTGYGRLIVDGAGVVESIREERDCTADERTIRSCNAGIYCISAEILRRELPRLTPHNAAGELYLTDLVERCASAGILSIEADAQEVAGVNTPEQLSAMEAASATELLRDPPTTRPAAGLAGDRARLYGSKDDALKGRP